MSEIEPFSKCIHTFIEFYFSNFVKSLPDYFFHALFITLYMARKRIQQKSCNNQILLTVKMSPIPSASWRPTRESTPRRSCCPRRPRRRPPRHKRSYFRCSWWPGTRSSAWWTVRTPGGPWTATTWRKAFWCRFTEMERSFFKRILSEVVN